MFSPVVEQLAKNALEQYVVAKINVGDYPELAFRYRNHIQYVPTILILKGGKVVEKVELTDADDADKVQLRLFAHLN